MKQKKEYDNAWQFSNMKQKNRDRDPCPSIDQYLYAFHTTLTQMRHNYDCLLKIEVGTVHKAVFEVFKI